MKLTKNEKEVLITLIKNAKESDSSISKKLKVSSQAVGKIRKKLEKEIIISYSAKLDSSKLGLKLFAISLSKLTEKGIEAGESEVEKEIISEPRIIQAYRVPKGQITHILFYSFRDIEELDDFFNSRSNKISLFFENIQIFTFSNHSIIKDDKKELYESVLKDFNKNLIENSKKNKIKKFKEKLID